MAREEQSDSEDDIQRFASRDHYDIGMNALNLSVEARVHNEKMELLAFGIGHMLAAIARKR